MVIIWSWDQNRQNNELGREGAEGGPGYNFVTGEIPLVFSADGEMNVPGIGRNKERESAMVERESD